jgi:hypothetical protein
VFTGSFRIFLLPLLFSLARVCNFGVREVIVSMKSKHKK